VHQPTATTGEHLQHIARQYPALRHQLTTHGIDTWPPTMGMDAYLATLSDQDRDRLAAERRTERAERTPDAMGERPVPIRLAVLDALLEVDALLLEAADQTAATVQRPVIGMPAGDLAGWTMTNISRRAALAREDRTDPRRWHYGGAGRDGAAAAGWLLARIDSMPGPCRELTDTERRHIARVASAARARLDRALGVVEQADVGTRPCPSCGGQLVLTQPLEGDPWVWCDGACGGRWRGPELAQLHDDLNRRAAA
jgi:hypothetical protein